MSSTKREAQLGATPVAVRAWAESRMIFVELAEDLTVAGIVAGRFQLPMPEPVTAMVAEPAAAYRT